MTVRAARAWHVYLLRCADDSLYVGITNDLAKRLAAHNAGKGGAYTRSRRPVAFAFTRRCGSATVARRLELAFKRLDRRRRLLLVAGDASVLAAALRQVARWRAARRRRTQQ